MAAQEVVGHPPPDAVEFDPLPDRPRAGQDAGHVVGQHFRGQHLQLHRHAQPVFCSPSADAQEDFACQEHLPRCPALQPEEVGQPLGIGLVGPGQPELLQFLLLRGIRDLR